MEGKKEERNEGKKAGRKLVVFFILFIIISLLATSNTLFLKWVEYIDIHFFI